MYAKEIWLWVLLLILPPFEQCSQPGMLSGCFIVPESSRGVVYRGEISASGMVKGQESLPVHEGMACGYAVPCFITWLIFFVNKHLPKRPFFKTVDAHWCDSHGLQSLGALERWSSVPV